MKTLFNNDWQFCKTKPGCKAENYKEIQIPHDWLIYNSNDLYESSYGHYKKSYDFGDITGKSIRLFFEGVYMDCTVSVNGNAAFEWRYGYSSFEADITKYLHNGINDIEVEVRHMSPNTRWYSGAGIYRDVWLIVTPASHLATDGVYFHHEKRDNAWDCYLSAETVNADNMSVRFTLENNTKVLYSNTLPARNLTEVAFVLENISDNDIWDIASPNLLTLKTELICEGNVIDSITQKTGLRQIQYTTDNGFYLNGKHVKMNGVCLHHDLGCLGAAFNKSAARRQLETMMEMGVNAIRTSHNMPAKGLMELCDEMGILVDSEAYDMWERPKTEYDNARFFNEWFEKDVASWVRRDRNHPSIVMWSVGNEIYDTHVSPRGCEVAESLHNAVRKHDPKGNAPTTIGSNYMPWEGAQNCARKVDLVGYNYGENLYRKHHEENPEWKIYGSETTSGVKSRGVYHFPRKAAFLTHEDLQCSSLGNCRAGISADTPQKIIALDRDCELSAGMFIWTGADYIGEPSPYSTKNAYFGNIDTAGLKKDSFYLYQAAWGNKPVLHVLPYWDFNDGQLIDVVAYTNLSQVELFVNDKSWGVQTPEEYTVAWQIPYEKGTIRVTGKTSDGTILEDVKHSFSDSASIVLNCNKDTVKADGEDIFVVEISTMDKDGYAVENARDRIHIDVENGRLMGFDNGDSTDYDSYKSASRKLFSGKAVAYIAPNTTAGQILITASGKGLTPATITVNAVSAPIREGVSTFENITEKTNMDEVPVRKIELIRDTSVTLTPDCPTCNITASILPANASYQELVWTVVTNSGIETNIASVKACEGGAVLTATGDGSFRLRCVCNNGKPQAEVISEYEFIAEGFGQACINPYEFLPACLYNDSISEMDEVSKGGVNIKEHNNVVGFTKTDFGKYGTKKFLIRVINWHKDDPFTFRLWLGKPDAEGSEYLGEYTYQANFIWQTYQDNHYELPKVISGIQNLYFEFEKTDMRIDFGGFLFEPNLKAYEVLNAVDCDLIHGDSYEIKGSSVLNIGNNTFLDFDEMNFVYGTKEIRVTGKTHHDKDSVHVHFADDTGIVCEEIFEFPYSDEPITLTKELPDLRGNISVKFRFLPGCAFDLDSFVVIPKDK
ncbi:MAG: DUF4982 domain-containing protein [Lachnospiraceae bacterium]|nr:DUF4982 domain-containing protein [Lachnospiraceae bacterium]